MEIWGARTKMSRGRGEVVPMNVDDDGAEDTNSKMDKRLRREPPRPPVPRRRLLPARGWLGCFLLLNIVAIVGFIVACAWYFPSASTTGIVEKALKQGDVSLLELPHHDDDDADTNDEPVNNNEQPLAPADSTLVNPTTSALPVVSPTQHEKPRLRADDESRIKVLAGTTQPPAVESPHPALGADPHIVSEASTSTQAVQAMGDPLETLPPAGKEVEAMRPQETTALPPTESETATPLVSAVRSQSMEEVLRRMKGMEKTRSALPVEEPIPAVAIIKKQEQDQTSVDPHSASPSPFDDDGEQKQHDPSVPLNDRVEKKLQDSQTEHPDLPGEEGLEENLVTWLKADNGVEVENAVECEALGTGCEVTSWKSVSRGQLEPVVFQPVDGRIRPVLQPASVHKLPTVAFSCGMAHTSGFMVHEMMTLFFVLSPTRIELGDTYSAQKFFGNAPNGQFLLHGGKPGFFTAAGLVEGNSVASNGQLLMVTYRLHRHNVEIKMNGLAWSPKQTEEGTSVVRVSGNAALSLGNVNSVCDTNAFHGRIAEVLVYDAVLSDDRVDAVGQYLRLKWWGEKLPVNTESPPENVLADDRADLFEADVKPANSVISKTANEAAPANNGLLDAPQPQEAEGPHREETEQPAHQELGPRTFDPEGVFEWIPSVDLLAVIAREQGSDPSSLVGKWKQAVSEKVASVRNFQLGGEILRNFIRERRDELLTLRDEIFGR